MSAARRLLGRMARRLALNPVFRTVGRVVVPRLDRALHRLSGGRIHVGDLVVPTLLLTVPGRRSGRPRTVPLAYAPDGDGYLVCGSNWGQKQHPAWTANLLAAGHGIAEIGRRRVPVRGVLLEGRDRWRAWDLLTQAWPAYDDYTDRAAGRELRVFRLEPISGHPAAGDR